MHVLWSVISPARLSGCQLSLLSPRSPLSPLTALGYWSLAATTRDHLSTRVHTIRRILSHATPHLSPPVSRSDFRYSAASALDTLRPRRGGGSPVAAVAPTFSHVVHRDTPVNACQRGVGRTFHAPAVPAMRDLGVVWNTAIAYAARVAHTMMKCTLER